MFEDVPLSKITIGPRFRQDLGDIPGLAASIETLGLLHPIIVTTAYALVVGRRRLAAHAHLGRDTIEARVIDLDDLMPTEVEENQQRKDYTISEWVAIGAAREARDPADAAARMREAGKQGGRGKKKPSGKLPEGFEAGEARDITANAVGLSYKTYEHAKAVCRAAQQDPECQDLVEAMDRTGNVTAAYNKIPPYILEAIGVPAAPTKAKVIHLWPYDTIVQKLDHLMQDHIVPALLQLDAEDRANIVELMRFYLHYIEHPEEQGHAETTMGG